MYAQVYDEVNYSLNPICEGQSSHILIETSPSNIRTDVALSTKHHLKLWGQLKTGDALPLYKASVILIQASCAVGHIETHQIAFTKTDLSGFYFFEATLNLTGCYKLMIQPRNLKNCKLLSLDFTNCSMPASFKKHCHQILLQPSTTSNHEKGGSYI
ncbi:MAG: hypothetical protein ACRDDX_03140 [Cellulosilyticaceae bacterium]